MKVPRGFTLHELLIGMVGVASAALMIGWICVIIHFVVKFW